MKKYRFVSFFLTVLIALSVLSPGAMAAGEPEITAGAALLMDANYDEVLYEKNADEIMYPASITKVMTALLTVEAIEAGKLSMDDVITATSSLSTDLTPNGSTQGITVGEQMTVRDLLHCLMVASANEAGNILGEAVAGSVPAFVDMMNQRAKELGCTNTHYTNTHGLHNDDHYTTAHDLYLIAKQAMQYEDFRAVSAAKSYTVPATNKRGKRLFYNRNALLVTWYYKESYIYDKAIGIKTGTTNEAGLCLLSAAVDGDDYLICVVLKADTGKNADGSTVQRQFSESKALLKWGFANFERKQVVDLSTPLAQVAVTLSETDHVLVRPGSQLERTLPVDVTLDDIVQTVQLNAESVQAPVAEGQVLGKLTLSYLGEDLGTVDLVAVNAVERSELLYKLDRIKTILQDPLVRAGIVVAVVLILLLVLRLTVFRRRGRSRYGSRTRRSGGGYSGRRR